MAQGTIEDFISVFNKYGFFVKPYKDTQFYTASNEKITAVFSFNGDYTINIACFRADRVTVEDRLVSDFKYDDTAYDRCEHCGLYMEYGVCDANETLGQLKRDLKRKFLKGELQPETKIF